MVLLIGAVVWQSQLVATDEFEIPTGGELDRASPLSLARAVADAGREASS